MSWEVAFSLAATLTSYSENMERGGKYSEGSRGNLKLWQSQKSGMDSFLYRVDENMTASTYSLNKIPERNLESMSSHSAHSIPLYLMPRPNSVAGESLPLPFLLLIYKESGKGLWCVKNIYKTRLFTGSTVSLNRKRFSVKTGLTYLFSPVLHPVAKSFSFLPALCFLRRWVIISDGLLGKNTLNCLLMDVWKGFEVRFSRFHHFLT